MDQLTQSNSANSEETASASESLNQQALLLGDVVQQMSGLFGIHSTTVKINNDSRQDEDGSGYVEDNGPMTGPFDALPGGTGRGA